MVAAASRGGGGIVDPAAAAAAAEERVRSAASVSSDRSADRSLDGLDDNDAAAADARAAGKKKDKKKEKSKSSGLLKGLFGSKKNKVRIGSYFDMSLMRIEALVWKFLSNSGQWLGVRSETSNRCSQSFDGC